MYFLNALSGLYSILSHLLLSMHKCNHYIPTVKARKCRFFPIFFTSANIISVIQNNIMKRRTLFESLLLLGATGIGRNAAQAAGIVEKNTRRIKPGRPFIEAPDGTNLFFQDWG